MKSQTGQLGRRATNAVMPIAGATPTAARKTSFRGSMTFVPYKHEQGDSDDSEEEESEEEEVLVTPTSGNPQQPGNIVYVCTLFKFLSLFFLRVKFTC